VLTFKIPGHTLLPPGAPERCVKAKSQGVWGDARDENRVNKRQLRNSGKDNDDANPC